MITVMATVRLRRGEGWSVQPWAEAVDGKRHKFTYGWPLEYEDSIYYGEDAWVPDDEDWPLRLTWIADGDLIDMKIISAGSDA